MRVESKIRISTQSRLTDAVYTHSESTYANRLKVLKAKSPDKQQCKYDCDVEIEVINHNGPFQ